MKFWITMQYYGGDITLIEQAARDVHAQLIAVKGYSVQDYPADREYVEGNAQYLFLLERETLTEAQDTLDVELRLRVRELVIQKYNI